MDLGVIGSLSHAKLVLVLSVILAWVLACVIRALSTAYLGPLSKFPGPRLAALSRYWHAYVECIQHRSFYDVLVQLHEEYGQFTSRVLECDDEYTHGCSQVMSFA